MTILSAPANSGYEEQFETVGEARAAAANILDIDVDFMIETESGDGGTTYCYATQEDADDDTDGAYAVQYYDADDQ